MKNTILTLFIPISFFVIVDQTLKSFNEKPIANVSIDHEDVEIKFVPTHSLYQKRCVREDVLVYCASLDSLTTVSIPREEIEIEFIADGQ